MKKQAQIFHFDLYGKREDKYDFLKENSIASIEWTELNPEEPELFFVPKDFDTKNDYDIFIKIDDLLNINGVGICSKRDETAIKFNKKELLDVLNDFKELSETEIKSKYKTEATESRDKKLDYAKDNIAKFGLNENYLQKINYRPFDTKWTYFTNQSRGFLAYPVYAIMKHFVKSNYGLVVSKKSRQLSLGYVFITNSITDLHILDSAADSTYIFPLYLYSENNGQQTIEQTTERVPNLNMKIVAEIEKKLGLQFVAEKNPKDSNVYSNDDTSKHTTPSGSHIGNLSDAINIRPLGSFAPIDILDYIYAVLHSPTYREKYKEFLKIDFPRVPFPKDQETFWKLVALGKQIREIHLLESPIVENYITQYPESGDNKVTKPRFVSTSLNDRGNVYINETQYFANVPEVAWNFYIGGYQPAQKWLKDRKDRTLEFDDILHYQKIIVALTNTDILMKEIDKIEIE